jgi:O-antigen/teichoic acid export membrane protein
MGCLPLIVFFVLGAVIGYVFWGDNGMLWGSGIGLVLGLLSAGWFVWWLRKIRNGNTPSPPR